MHLSHLLVIAELVAEYEPRTAKNVKADDLGCRIAILHLSKGTYFRQEVLHFLQLLRYVHDTLVQA